jgi:RNA polymerase sigma factor (sigma-70 family)
VHAREIVTAIAAGDVTGLGSAFDEYAPDLYAYCQSRLAEPADAADAVQDVFILASANVSELGQPERLRAWLFALARNECHRRLRAIARSAPLYEAAAETADDAAGITDGTDGTAAGTVDGTVDSGPGAGQADPRALVPAALAGLNAGEREVCELNLRHDLYGADLGDVLGVPRDQVQTLASQAQAQFGTSLGVLLAAGSGPEYCPELAASLDGRGATLTGLRRALVRRHVERCEVCREHTRRDLSPAVMAGLLPLPELPAGLRQRMLHLATDVAPDAAAHRGEVTRRAEPFGAAGFPVQLSSPSATRWQSAHAMAAVAAVTALAVLGGGMFYVDYASAHAGSPPATVAGTAPAGPRAIALDPQVSVPSAAPASRRSAPGSSAPAFIPSATGSSVPSPLRTLPATTPSGRLTSPSGSTSPPHSTPPTHSSPSPTHASPSPTHPSPVPTTPRPTSLLPTAPVPTTAIILSLGQKLSL